MRHVPPTSGPRSRIRNERKPARLSWTPIPIPEKPLPMIRTSTFNVVPDWVMPSRELTQSPLAATSKILRALATPSVRTTPVRDAHTTWSTTSAALACRRSAHQPAVPGVGTARQCASEARRSYRRARSCSPPPRAPAQRASPSRDTGWQWNRVPRATLEPLPARRPAWDPGER